MSSSRKAEALRLVENIVGDKPTAEMVLERLQEEGFLHLGYGDRDVDLITQTFSQLFGNTKTSTADRRAAHRLAKSKDFGSADGMVAFMKLYHQYVGDKYAPVAGSVAEFEDKLPKIVIFMRKVGQERQQNQEIQL